MADYNELKAELLDIAEVLKKYPAELQPQVFEILTSQFLGPQHASHGHRSKSTHVVDGTTTKREEVAPAVEQDQKPVRRRRGAGKSKESYSIVKDLRLRGKDNVQGFQEFVDEKKPTTNIDFTTVAVYYLSEVLKLNDITPDHVYTCYKVVARKVPGSLKANIYDASSKYGYLNAQDMNAIAVSHHGENHVEHDLPKPEKGGSR